MTKLRGVFLEDGDKGGVQSTLGEAHYGMCFISAKSDPLQLE
jgi:hypothetical protein